VIWRIQRRDGWLYIYLLLEFQSAVDPRVALRILVYTGLLYQDLIRRGEVSRGEKLPAVFPLSSTMAAIRGALPATLAS